MLHNVALKFGLYLFDCLGVVQLLNKLDGTSFNKNDENLFEVFLYFICHFSSYRNFHCRSVQVQAACDFIIHYQEV